jgi:hypothetical protein
VEGAEVKRSGFKPRQTPLRATAPAKTSVPLLKMRKCANCPERFRPFSSLVKWCSPECGAALGLKKLKQQKDREHRAKLADVKPLSHWLDLTQRVVNAYVLARDAGKPCISCGCWDAFAWDAGHFLSRGARPELRFTLDNIARQCAACNRHKGGNAVQFRLGLVARIGLERVEALEGPHPPAKFTREGLEQLRRDVAAMTRQLQKGEVCTV